MKQRNLKDEMPNASPSAKRVLNVKSTGNNSKTKSSKDSGGGLGILTRFQRVALFGLGFALVGGIILVFASSAQQGSANRSTVALGQSLDRALRVIKNREPRCDERSTAMYNGLILNRSEEEVQIAMDQVDWMRDNFDELFPETNPTNDTEFGECYHQGQVLWRTYFDPRTNKYLSEEDKRMFEDAMWKIIYRRSQLKVANGTSWNHIGSENHDALHRYMFVIFTQALMQTDKYKDQKLADKGTLQQHHDAWVAHVKEYARQKAREGLQGEIASPNYTKSSMGSFYNIYDFTTDQGLKDQVEKLITLYWADYANDINPVTHVQSPGSTRYYRQEVRIHEGHTETLRQWSWLYGWHDDNSTIPHEYTAVPATSSYRIPQVITDMAKDKNKPPFHYVARRFGLGPESKVNDYNQIKFENGNSFIRDDTWQTPAYTIGTLTMDPSKEYIGGNQQNRAMGVEFSDSFNSRMFVFAEGLTRDGTAGYADINGASAKDALIFGRDVNAKFSRNPVIFVSLDIIEDSLRARGSFESAAQGTWLFGASNDAYIGVRIAGTHKSERAYLDGELTGGYITPVNPWAPIVIQLGQKSDYESFDAFKKSIEENAFVNTSESTTYTTEAGETLRFFRESTKSPQYLNTEGELQEINQKYTYKSPYIEMVHGNDVVTFNYGGKDLKLDFSY